MLNTENQQMAEIESIIRASLNEIIFSRKKSDLINELLGVDSDFKLVYQSGFDRKIQEHLSGHAFDVEFINIELDEDLNVRLNLFLDIFDQEKNISNTYAVVMSENEFHYELLKHEEGVQHSLVQQQSVPSSVWYAVTTHICDGHEADEYFYTDDFEVVQGFARSRYPLLITTSMHASLEAVEAFFSDFSEDFKQIDPAMFA